MGGFLYQVAYYVIGFLIFVLIANAVLSWLVAFDVINLRNQFVRQLAQFLDAVSRPVLRPFQKIIPPLGGIDITPIIAIIILSAAQGPLLSWIFRPIIAALGG